MFQKKVETHFVSLAKVIIVHIDQYNKKGVWISYNPKLYFELVKVSTSVGQVSYFIKTKHVFIP
jgi:hypothetical protein